MKREEVLTSDEIREWINLSISRMSPAKAHEVSATITRGIRKLKDLLLDCKICGAAIDGSCPECVKIQETIGWALGKLVEISK